MRSSLFVPLRWLLSKIETMTDKDFRFDSEPLSEQYEYLQVFLQ
jgi:hypothetical protein